MAQRTGFEPLNAFNTLHDFQSCAFDQLSHLCTASLLNSKGYYNGKPAESQEKYLNFFLFFCRPGNIPALFPPREEFLYKNPPFRPFSLVKTGNFPGNPGFFIFTGGETC